MDVAKYKTLFVSETREYLQSISRYILQLQETHSEELYDHLFRAAHSVKGMAASMGFVPMKEVSHGMEDLLQSLKKGDIAFSNEMIAVFFHGLDLLESMVDEVDRTGVQQLSAESFARALERVQRSAQRPEQAKKVALEIIAPEPQKTEEPFTFTVEIKIADDASLPGARAVVAVKRLQEIGTLAALMPPLQAFSTPAFEKHFRCRLSTKLSAAEVHQELNALADIGSVHVSNWETVPAEPSADAPKITNVRVETKRLDQVVEGLGELLILNAQMQESFPQNPEVSRLQILTKKLYENVLDLRMLPFETLSSRFPRMIHDLCQALQKKALLKVVGADIQLDKSILDEIADPLIHLIRNAVDHGIEAPATRVLVGKDETGTIQLLVQKQGDRVLIRMEDDGKGIDPQLIRRTAVNKGLITDRLASILNQQEVLNLITTPGFTTAREVSDISGRGVGLDVVRDRIDKLGGSLKIYSTPGQFTRFDVTIPFTVAVISALLFRAGSQTFAVPLSRVDRFLLLRKSDVHYTQGRPVIFYDNSTLYIENLTSLLYRRPIEFASEFTVFVTEHQNRKIAWSVDELIAETQIMLKSLGEPLNLIPTYNGATVLGKGEVIPVLDVEHLYRERFQ